MIKDSFLIPFGLLILLYIVGIKWEEKRRLLFIQSFLARTDKE